MGDITISTKRKEMKLTQIELAKLVGISQGTLSLYESGKRHPDVKTAKRIAENLGVSIEEIF